MAKASIRSAVIGGAERVGQFITELGYPTTFDAFKRLNNIDCLSRSRVHRPHANISALTRHMRRALGPWCLAAIALWLPGRAAAQGVRAEVPAVAAHAVRDGIAVDGRLNEPAWITTAPATDFKQRDPDEGEPATEHTELRILYDELAVYVGVRLFDRDPSKVVARMSRRDNQADADRFTLYLDPYHDHLTGVMFEVSAAGVQYDAAVSADTTVDARGMPCGSRPSPATAPAGRWRYASRSRRRCH
jgi:hypothetical protein